MPGNVGFSFRRSAIHRTYTNKVPEKEHHPKGLVMMTKKQPRGLTSYESSLFDEGTSPEILEAYKIISNGRPLDPGIAVQAIMDSPYIVPENGSFNKILAALFTQRTVHDIDHITFTILDYCKRGYISRYPANLVIGLMTGICQKGDLGMLGCKLGYTAEIFQHFMLGEFSFCSLTKKQDKCHLSEAVSKFVSGASDGGIGERLGCAINAIAEVRKSIEAGTKLSPFGEIFLNELCYKTMGRLPIDKKMDALVGVLKEVLSPAPNEEPVAEK